MSLKLVKNSTDVAVVAGTARHDGPARKSKLNLVLPLIVGAILGMVAPRQSPQPNPAVTSAAAISDIFAKIDVPK
jgi:hypothetical protein